MRGFGLKTCLRLANFFFVVTHSPELLQVQLVILLSINIPIAPHPNIPRIIIQLWRGYLPHDSSPATQKRQARMVWEADWTHSVTPLYILSSDIFRGPAPAAYGDNDRVHLNAVAWRQAIIDSSFLHYF